MDIKLDCRICHSSNITLVLDLGESPIANNYLSDIDQQNENFFELALALCNTCKVVQTTETLPREAIFENNYAYFSSTSSSWLDHSKKFADQVCEEFELTQKSKVVEIASNDGYLLQFFQARGIQVIGVEPTLSTAKVAISKGIPTVVEFFGQSRIQSLIDQNVNDASLIVANNVLAHVPDLIDFLSGMKSILNPEGIISIEIPHLKKLIENNSFDTVYHEHYSYFSVLALEPIFRKVGLRIFRIDDLLTHGGSIRIYACHLDAQRPTSKSVIDTIQSEANLKLDTAAGFGKMEFIATRQKKEFIDFLSQNRDASIYGYGAAAKGNTFLNYCEVNSNDMKGVFDAAKSKQGKYLPGSRLPVLSPQLISELKPDFLVIFPWNISDEVIRETEFISNWGGKHVLAMPTFRILE